MFINKVDFYCISTVYPVHPGCVDINSVENTLT